jgi:hypothetical protein
VGSPAVSSVAIGPGIPVTGWVPLLGALRDRL